jgi:hypothetical protein
VDADELFTLVALEDDDDDDDENALEKKPDSDKRPGEYGGR